MIFKPTAVDKENWKTWFAEGLELSKKGAMPFFFLAVGYSAFDYFIHSYFKFLFFVTIPIFLGMGVIVAYCVDEEKPIFNTIHSKPFGVWKRLILIGITPYLILSLIGLVLYLLPSSAEKFVITPPSDFRILFEGGLTTLFWLMFWFFILGFHIWFLIPLVSCENIPISIACRQASDAYDLNGFVLKIILSIAFICLFSLFVFQPLFVFPIYAITSCMMYLCYKQVWYGKKANRIISKIKNKEVLLCKDV